MATNLEFIKSLTPDGSSSSLSITNVFSAKYTNYVVTYQTVTDSGSPKDTDLRLINSSDAIVTNSNYDYTYQYMSTGSGHTSQRNSGQDKWTGILGATDFPPEGNTGKIQVVNPFAASWTYITYQVMQSHNGTNASHKGIGVLKEATSITGLNIFLSSTNFTAGSNIAVYGVKT